MRQHLANLIFSVLFLAFCSSSITAQNYVQITDASGLQPTMADISPVLEAADSLVGVLAPEYQDSFKVFDFGFYLHNEVFQGGYPSAFELAAGDVEQVSKYYLLFGRQSDASGVNRRFWVRLHLPVHAMYPCAVSSKHVSYENLVTSRANEFVAKGLDSPSEYVKAEVEAILSIVKEVSHDYNCCLASNARRSIECDSSGCSYDEATIADILTGDGFSSFDHLQATVTPSTAYSKVETAFKIVLDLNGVCNGFPPQTQLDLTDDLEQLLSDIEIEGGSGKVKIHYLNDATVCDFEGYFNPASPAARVAPYHYEEEIFILDFDGSRPRIFYRFELGDITPSAFQRSSFANIIKRILRGLMKRAATNPGTVIVGVLTEYSLEALFYWWLEADEDESYWYALYQVVKNRGIVGAGISVASNAINSPVAIFIGAIADYMRRTDVADWTVGDMLIESGIAAVVSLVANNLSAIKNGRILLRDIRSDGGGTLLLSMVWNRGLVKAWSKLFKAEDAISDFLRKNMPTLEWFAKHGDDIPQSATDDLISGLGGKTISESYEDAFGRMVVTTQSSGATRVVATVEKTATGEFKSFKYR